MTDKTNHKRAEAKASLATLFSRFAQATAS